MADRVILYTTPNCPTSDAARAGLIEMGVDFEERDVMDKQEWFDECVRHSISVPVILWGDRVEIGWKGRHG
jgi:glutaredoxin